MGKSQDETLPKPLPGTGDQAESEAIYAPLDGTGDIGSELPEERPEVAAPTKKKMPDVDWAPKR